MTAPPTTLRDYANSGRLYTHCPKCQLESPVNLMRWARLVGWDSPFATVQRQLRCAECGNNVGIEIRGVPAA